MKEIEFLKVSSKHIYIYRQNPQINDISSVQRLFELLRQNTEDYQQFIIIGRFLDSSYLTENDFKELLNEHYPFNFTIEEITDTDKSPEPAYMITMLTNTELIMSELNPQEEEEK